MVLDIRKSWVGWVKWGVAQTVVRYDIRVVEKIDWYGEAESS